ncbi:MAG: VOC family protein [bacterium]|nr:VOC family protein [bacterium]
MKLNRIDHVAIICSDYQKSKEFYVNLLGLEIIQEIHRLERRSCKLDLSLNGLYQIELFSFPDPPSRLTNPEARGLRHLAFQVDDLDKAVEELKRKGVATEAIRVDTSRNKRCFFFQDPDGLPIEFCEA